MYNRAMHLHQAIQSKVNAWREAGYPSPDYPAVAEILEYATLPLDDGQVFAIALSDAPARKDDLVLGRYELPASAGPTTVAVKIVDMLGEEVLATATV